jgi:integrase
MSEKVDPVQAWLDACSINTRYVYRTYFTMFSEYMKKSGQEMLDEYRSQIPNPNPEIYDYYPTKIFEFYKLLLSGKIKVKKMGSTKGKRGGWTGKYKDKPLSQQTCRTAINSVQSFFAFYNLPINLKKFIKKDVRMKKPKPERKKHQLLAPEIDSLFKVASLRDKAILALGLMGQDESTVTAFRIEQFDDKVSGKTLEIVETTRPKTNEDILLILVPETQDILRTYIKTLGVKRGWLFSGYKNQHVNAQLANDVFQELCEKAGIKDNQKRLSFHCCRMWFSAQLRNKVSDDLIDALTGHVTRYGGAYFGDIEKTKQSLLEAGMKKSRR